MQGGQNREYADSVADEIRGVFGVDDAFTECGDQKAFQRFEHVCIGVFAGNQFDQMHVAGRIEEVQAAESMVK